MSTSRERSGPGPAVPGPGGGQATTTTQSTGVEPKGTTAASDHALLGGRCFADDDFEGARYHWEVAFREFRRARDLRSAARVAGDLAGLHVSRWGNRAVARGWIDRGLRLVRQVGHCVEEGYLALAILGCDQPDVEALEASAELALSLAIEFSDPVLEVRALAESGFALVAEGQLARGFALLDEAMAAVTSGEIEDVSAMVKCFCAMLSACDRSGELRRAQEWTAEVSRFIERHEGRPRILHTHCRAVYGSLLSTLGRWPEAEQAMLEALTPGASQAMNHRMETSARLAELRLRQGRLAEAEELLGPFEDCVDCCAPLARLHLAQGHAELAAAVIERGLGELVGDRVRAAPLLALLVEVGLARDDLDAATDATRRLSALARGSDWPLVQIEAALAAAKVAAKKGDTGGAFDLLDEAQRGIADSERPLLVGQVHLERARVWVEAAEATRAVSEGRAALAVFERLGAARDGDEAAALLRSLGDRGRTRRAQPAESALSTREREVLELIGEGLTNAEIGARLYISTKTAEHHVSAVLSKLGVRSRAEAAARAANLTSRS